MTELDLKNESPNDAKPVLAAVPFLDEPTNLDWNDNVMPCAKIPKQIEKLQLK